MKERTHRVKEKFSSFPQERLGLVIGQGGVAHTVETIVRLEQAGVKQIWLPQGTPFAPDVLTTIAAVAAQTAAIQIATAVVPISSRHPTLLAQQVLGLSEIAPQRLQLGIGIGEPVRSQQAYGTPPRLPLSYLKEYLSILRSLLEEGKVEHHGQYFHVQTHLPAPAPTPLLLAALGQKAFYLAGQIADGAISWMCPPSYLITKALPALREGAASVSRPLPRLIGHVPVILHREKERVWKAAREYLAFFAGIDVYRRMFAAAGFPFPGSANDIPDGLIEHLFLYGDEDTIKQRLFDLLESGIDEIIIDQVVITNEQEERMQVVQIMKSISRAAESRR
jgi:alkanesulfonate monooxygenase SsuD/methylene tetrahydromethanopterin reductase-like flavin-dependent oxidoreductase (luciferase family)